MIDAHLIDARGVYLHTVRVDPLGPQPAGAIYEPLPNAQEGHQRVWNGGSWQQMDDDDLQLPGPQEPVVEPPKVWEVPRWAGKLALMRHVLVDGQLLVLTETESRPEDNLLARVLTYRATLPAGELVDRIDVALNDAKDWLRNSPTVGLIAEIMPLSAEQLDELFTWAAAQIGSV